MKRLLLLIIVAVLLPLPACGEQSASAPDGDEIAVYYVVPYAEGGRDVVRSVLRTVPEEENKIGAALSFLFRPPAGANVYSPLPWNLSVRSWSLEQGQITVDFSEEYSELTGMDLTLADSCIVLTLTGLEEIGSVNITVEGKPVPQREKQVFTRDDILLEADFEENN